ncbi:MAG TPA: fibronectin type III domain-containing protein, partial [Chitinophagales bacterium]|nr:fibronectin type III domain-containing protein [Chitinophagales bacterium]
KYRVRVKRLGALGGAWSTYFVNASQSSLMLDSLVPGAIYKFRVRSQCSPNGADLSAWSAPQYFTVNAGVAVCAAPSGIATANASASGTDINWTPVTGAYGYRIRYREIGTTGWTPMVINNGNIASFTLSGLQASTTFEFQIATKCEVGPTVFSTFSPIGTFTTTGLRFAELDATYTLALYPNPASSEVNLQIPHELANAELVVYNAVGQVVRQLDIANETSLRIDVSHLAAGLYVVELRSAQTRIRGRLVKE